MNWNKRIRETHRWLSITFTVLVLVNIVLNIVATGSEQLTMWVGILTLVPLVLLMFTGLYLFVLPYIGGKHGKKPAAEDGREESLRE